MKFALAALAVLTLTVASLAASPVGSFFPGWFAPRPPYTTPGVDWYIHPDYLNAGPPHTVVDDQMRPWNQ